MSDFQVVNIKPLETASAWLLPVLATRIRDFAKIVNRDPDSEAFTRRFLARLVIGDKYVQAAVGVADPPTGDAYMDVIGHCLGEIVEIDGENVLFVLQVESSPGYRPLLDKFMEEADIWCKSMQITRMRSEVVETIPESVWLRLMKRFNWKLVSRVMERPVK